MLKNLLIAASIVLGMVGAASASTLEEVRASTYMLFSNDRPICSGTMVKNNKGEFRFLTAAHCIETNSVKSIKRNTLDENLFVIKQEVFLLRLVSEDKKNDVATLKVVDTTATFDTADVATIEEASTIRLGDEVMNSHYPISASYLDHIFTPGIFNGIVRAPVAWTDEDFVYLTTTQAVKGSSGGGLYAEFDGEWKLIGTVEGGPDTVDFLNMFTTTDSVVGILSEE